MNQDRVQERLGMVSSQIRDRGIRSPAVLHAMETVPRHLFVPDRLSGEAYQDHPLPIGHGQTISQPYIVAWMTELLAPSAVSTILEIGSGSGYQAAVLAETGARVITIERIPEVAELARFNLHKAGYDSVTVLLGDGTCGLPDYAPYNGILITAAAPEIPAPLLGQIAEGGCIVAPVGPAHIQEIVRLTKTRSGLSEERFGSVRFVPLIGEFGWSGETCGL